MPPGRPDQVFRSNVIAATYRAVGKVHEAGGTVASCRALGDDASVDKVALSVLTNLAAADGEGMRGVCASFQGGSQRD
eukprot:scaffold1610_cov257-Pinguiococcus_pyrenoidosus.AAC.17